MPPSWIELVLAYVVVGAVVIGLPMIFFIVTFLPGLMRTTGELIGAAPAHAPPSERTAPAR